MKKIGGSKYKDLLNLSHEEARCFFLKNESYFYSVLLPEYFTFSGNYKDKDLKNSKSSDSLSFPKLLKYLSKEVGDKDINDRYFGKKRPKEIEDVNYKLFVNKKSNYDWRLLQLIHPLLYVVLANLITRKKNWEAIKKRFKEFRENSAVECTSLPVRSESKESDKAETITRWWEETEQKSIELALDYEYIYHLDITNCYSSIYTHSVPWALGGRDEVKKNLKKNGNKSENEILGDKIDKLLRAMSYGQTNGIPQGSTLMDFIGEIVLGYTDEELAKKLNSKKQDENKNFEYENFKILRYRDDYRVFVNNTQKAEEIIKKLSKVLAELGLAFNASKTVKSEDVIKYSIKPDKWAKKLNYGWSRNKNIQDQLIVFKDFADKYPESGSILSMMNSFYTRISNKEKDVKGIIKFFEILKDFTEALTDSTCVDKAMSEFYKELEFKKNKSTETLSRFIKRLKKIAEDNDLKDINKKLDYFDDSNLDKSKRNKDNHSLIDILYSLKKIEKSFHDSKRVNKVLNYLYKKAKTRRKKIDDIKILIKCTSVVRKCYSKEIGYSYRLNKKLKRFYKKLKRFYKRLEYKKREIKSVKALVSIIADIAFKNRKVYPQAISIINELIDFIEEDEREDLIKRFKRKFDKLPNNGYLEIWLQRITIKHKATRNLGYNEKLCKIVERVSGEPLRASICKNVMKLNNKPLWDLICKTQKNEGKLLWDSTWLEGNLKKKIDAVIIYDEKTMESMPSSVAPKEIALYNPFEY